MKAGKITPEEKERRGIIGRGKMMMRFREMSREVEALATNIFDDGVIKFVSSYTDHNDEHVMLVEWGNLDPGLLFAIREENRSDFWARVKKWWKAEQPPHHAGSTLESSRSSTTRSKNGIEILR